MTTLGDALLVPAAFLLGWVCSAVSIALYTASVLADRAEMEDLHLEESL
jgi:hypothetical protein